MMIHNGAAEHFNAPVHYWLDIAFSGRWIGYKGLVLWLPRSPDLTLLDFLLMGNLKELVYRDGVITQMDLVARPNAVCTSVDTTFQRRVHLSIPLRAQACLYMHG
ncbi:uncharacterized protein TNCV_4896151 [Trichonephila clavipes]|uniref:Uncharacterized protein n=1 Tax=Trichonephila clavipes TaxID=2585209 RepID=A0A8X6VWY3_TRICX|nr:uncharacterized protein TNCV_4896151 [Trichonephila clavipes]